MNNRRIEIACPRCGVMRSRDKYQHAYKPEALCRPCANETRAPTTTTHGLEKHPLYNTWQNMKKRCDGRMDATKNRHYLGVTIDPDWRDITKFVAWAEANGWKPGLSIERLDIAEGYEPGNCTWIPLKHQARNRRNNSVTPEMAAYIQALVSNGMVRYQAAKKAASIFGIPLSTANKVAYGYNWKD